MKSRTTKTEKITAAELIAELGLVDENIYAEAAKQPLLFIQAARYRVNKMRARSQALTEYEAHRASMSLRIRGSKTTGGDKRFTEGQLKEMVEADDSTKELRLKLDRAYENEEFSKLIMEAFRQRRDAIRIVADGQHAENLREGGEVNRIDYRREQITKARRLKRRANDLNPDED